MKNLFIYLFCLLLLSCSKNKGVAACGCDDVRKELPWLKGLINKAETDTTLTQANYWGCIWLEKHDGQDIFVTNMMLGSGGVAYWIFDCFGNHFLPYDDFKIKKNVVVYSNPSHIPCK
jgi:hypothetical protein